jgi:hypothetical protein
MDRRSALCRTLAMLATLILSTAAGAQQFRAYLSSSGNDANPCTVASPCRLLPTALNVVGDGGEIWMLDSANYNQGTVNITKSVTILAVPGSVGSILAIGGPAISIATAGVKVALRNLVIAGLPAAGGTHGIYMTNGASLTVSDCLITKVPGGTGVWVNAAATVRIADTTIRDSHNWGVMLLNGAMASITRSVISGNDNDGVMVEGDNASTTTSADISDSTIDGNSGTGVAGFPTIASAVVKVSVSNSRLSGNGNYGAATSGSAGTSTLLLHNNAIVNNWYGVGGFYAGAKVLTSGNTVSGNASYGLNNTSATFESAGNNAVRDNGTNVNGTITSIAAM